MSKPTYITTPIYYVNDRPHLGHAYTSTICDVYARFMRFAGRRVFFLTGTDEHGRKVEHSARDRGISPQQLADENAAEFQRVFTTLGLSNDDFIRTTQPRHVRQVGSFVKRLLETKAVYLGEFEGWYDEGQEEYYPESKARDLDYISPVNRKPLVRAKENNYYFRLSAYQKKLEDLYADEPGFVRPEARRNEMLAVLREGLQDVPVSRTNFTWGIPMPDDPQHVIYVWIDALMNYITALGLSEPEGELAADRAAFWPAAVSSKSQTMSIGGQRNQALWSRSRYASTASATLSSHRAMISAAMWAAFREPHSPMATHATGIPGGI